MCMCNECGIRGDSKSSSVRVRNDNSMNLSPPLLPARIGQEWDAWMMREHERKQRGEKQELEIQGRIFCRRPWGRIKKEGGRAEAKAEEAGSSGIISSSFLLVPLRYSQQLPLPISPPGALNMSRARGEPQHSQGRDLEKVEQYMRSSLLPSPFAFPQTWRCF